jgi:hypothetical protein
MEATNNQESSTTQGCVGCGALDATANDTRDGRILLCRFCAATSDIGCN